MKLLLDANLSWRLIEVLKAHFTEVMHVDQIDVKVPAHDEEIWQVAKMNNCIIVTNDQDFLDMVSVKGFPPKVIFKNRKSKQFLSWSVADQPCFRYSIIKRLTGNRTS